MRKTLTIVLLAVMVITGAFSSPYYDAGSQIFTINVGASVPFFTYNGKDKEAVFWPGTDDESTPEIENMNQLVGGIGSIAYQVFLNPYWAIGGELGYQFNYVAGTDVAASVPINMKVSYFPVQTGKFDLPISLGIGLDYISISDYSSINLGITFEIGMRYFFTNEWGAGITAGFHFVPELYGFTGDAAKKNSMYATVPLMISVTYRH